MTARTSSPSAPRRHPWLTVGLSASLTSCSQWLDVPSEPAVVEEPPPRITGPVAPPQWRPPLEGGRYYRQRDPPNPDSRPLPSEPPSSVLTPPVAQTGSGHERDAGRDETGGGRPADGVVLGPDHIESVDAGSPPPPPPPSPPPAAPPPPASECEGYELFGLCWYLGEPGASCEHVCSSHGGYDEAASAHVGTARQGGSREDCVLILNGLGQQYRARSIEREEGLGCHLAGDDADPYWASYPAFSATACLSDVRIACGCNQ